MVHHTGRLWVESAGEVSASLGWIRIERGRVKIAMSGVPIGSWATQTVRFEPAPYGRFVVVVSGRRIVFDPVDPVEFASESRAVTLSTELAEAVTPAGRAVSLAARPASTPEPHADAPRNPGLAALLSMIWAGLGQLYNGNLPLAIGLALLQVINVALFSVRVGYLGYAVVTVTAAIQAFREADRTGLTPGFR